MAQPRLRFAPSPTGMLHIGGVRTALFNWLWARKNGGAFVLRIEDTDRERSTPENEAIILRDMRWLGLEWDEGPDVGGPHGPYRQTERLDQYRRYAEILIERRSAFRCYCTKEDLAAAREALQRDNPKQQFRYPGTCRDRHDAPDRPFVVRLAAPSEGHVTYRDLVFGEVTTPNSAQQDVVLVRPDGVPVYNFGCVVDDITMGITLVARGRDHMINTPLQILVYEALGAEPPKFAHLPMMLAADGNKLSKRHGAVSVAEYRDRGIPAPALLNYLARFGWSFGDEEVFSLSDLVQKFGWDRCGRGDGKFDLKKLGAVAFEHLKRPDLTSDAQYAAAVLPFLEQRGLSSIDTVLLSRALPLIRPRAETLASAADWLDWLFRDPPIMDEKACAKFLRPDRAEHLRALASRLAAVEPFVAATLEAVFKAYLTETGADMGGVAQPMRVALTGRAASPGLFDVMELLGRERTLVRLERAAALAGAA